MTASAKTLRALERAAMRMVDRNGFLITQFSCRTFSKRRDDFEEAVYDHRVVAALKRKRTGRR